MTMRPDPRNHAPTAQTGDSAKYAKAGDGDWLDRAQSAYRASTSYMDTNLRKGWDDSIRAFNNQHPSDSKYEQPSYAKRSRVYRPKIRTSIRKNEAAAAAAFFSNMDVISTTPNDPSDKAEAASADIMKQLLQYRLSKTIPWYQIVLGGLQDAQVTGVVCAHVYWMYEPGTIAQALPEIIDQAEEVAKEVLLPDAQAPIEPEDEYPDQAGAQMPKGAMVAGADGGLADHAPAVEVLGVVDPEELPPKTDKPCIDLIPVENLRIDPSASWIDPVGTSPYIIHMIPMYAMDVKEKMDVGEWRELPEAMIQEAAEMTPDTTRTARLKDRSDPAAEPSEVDDYTVVWVQRHIHRRDGQDWDFYTLGDKALLVAPVPLSETVFTGKRPYVIGNCNLETHKVYATPIPMLAKGLADETNELANQRMDNVKFVLNKKFIVKRGREADVAGLIRNVPGGVVMMDNPQEDVRELTWQDVTASAYQEAQGLSMEMDQLLGNFDPAALMVNGGQNSPARNMAMLSNAQGTLVEYMLRTYVETFVQPVLRLLVLLEQEYETDAVVMRTAAKQAKLFQKFGIDAVTDDLLKREMTVTVNVGMGATDPMMRLNKFLTAMTTYTGMLQHPTPGIDMAEVGKEIFGHLGYADGSRFFSSDNPQLQVLQQQMQQMQGVMQQLQQKLAEKKEAQQIALQKTQVTANAGIQKGREANQAKIQATVIHEQNQNKRALATHVAALNKVGGFQGQPGQHRIPQ